MYSTHMPVMAVNNIWGSLINYPDFRYRHSGLEPESSALQFARRIRTWMPDQACPQLGWGCGMTKTPRPLRYLDYALISKRLKPH